MEDQRRGRSSSASRLHHIARQTPSPSPHAAYRALDTGFGLEQTQSSFENSFDPFDQQPTFNGVNFDPSAQLFQHQPNIAPVKLFQDQELPQPLSQALTSDATFCPQGSNLFDLSGNLGDTSGLQGSFDPQLLSSADAAGNPFEVYAFDPDLLASQPSQHSINPSSLVNPMSSHTQSPTPPHLLSPAMNRQYTGSSHGSPGMQQTGFQQPSPRHSRNTSLDPSSAAYSQQLQGGEWGGMAFHQHRRQPSESRSDISSSAHPSPYLGNVDIFEKLDHHSPLLGAQQDSAMYSEVMGIGTFSLSEHTPSYISPAHSPHISPRLLPQQQLPSFNSNDFGMMQNYVPLMNHDQFNGHQGLDMFPGQGQEAFPSLNQSALIDYNGEGAMSPPEINIQLAPPSRQTSFEPPKPEGPDGALSPPDRSRSRNRIRAKSDTSIQRARSNSSAGKTETRDMLSPQAAGVGSRSPSPLGQGRRSSTSSVPNRDYILDLADPSRPTSAAPGESTASKRTQKHPATFQCSLCPKRFTRAYNLRSHLRTHTDERPFVCSVCAKAFARQHDRKRHEGLHSGEKKFVCRGGLKDGSHWGCNRRFARADALGRHFRSEAGRLCIKPLLEEEAIERQNNQNRESGLQVMPGQFTGAQSMTQAPGYEGFSGAANSGFDPNMQMGVYRLPQALLQQYPTLGPLWDSLAVNGPDEMEDDISNRNSFDGSSAGEFEDEGDIGHGPQSGWASDVGPY